MAASSSSSSIPRPGQPQQQSSGLTPGLLISHILSALLLALVVSSTRNFQDSEDAMAFYGVYHQAPGNQLIHFFGVPCIIFTFLLFQAHLKLFRNSRFTWATVTALFYLIFYLSIDPIGAALFAPMLILMHWTAHMLVDFDQQDYRLEELERYTKKTDNDPQQLAIDTIIPVPWTGTKRMLYYALGLHILAWYAQIHPGHQRMEGARPALMTSLGDALTTAPLFAYYEGIWWLGLRKDFQKQVLRKVDKQTRILCQSGANMRVCESVLLVDDDSEEEDKARHPQATMMAEPYDSELTHAQRQQIGEMMRQHEMEDELEAYNIMEGVDIEPPEE